MTFIYRNLMGMALIATAMTPVFSASAAKATAKIEFNRDVRPILAENCFSCHGVDSASRKAGLRLDKFEAATQKDKDNKAAIVPGKPQESELIRRIMTADADDVMPPAKIHKTLTPEQKVTLRDWIASGAQYQPHWSYIAPVKAPVPVVRNKKWVRNPIDAFILARLEQEGLKPAPEADKRTLARRVCLDLTGLPPKPEEVEAFVNDKAKDAYEKYVDRLMATPAWGEHRGRYWLDAARYADSNGIHLDFYREMWSYREWVINAFNRNEPFDQFTIEQLAGDLLPKPTMDQQIATGFNRCNITTSEGGAIDEEYLVLYARDRTEATSQVWMGLTTGCAVCHDHKFDQISQKEFYSLSAFFNNTTQKAMDGNVKNTPPVIDVPTEKDRPRWAQLGDLKKEAAARVQKRKDSGQKDYDQWMATTEPAAYSKDVPKEKPLFRTMLDDSQTNSPKAVTKFTGTLLEYPKTNVVLNYSKKVTFQAGVLANNAYQAKSSTVPKLPKVGDFEGDKPYSASVWVNAAIGEGTMMARMDDTNDFRGWDFRLEGGKLGAHLVNKWPDSALKVISKRPIELNRWTHVCLTYDGSRKAAGMKLYIDGVLQENEVASDKLNTNSTRTKIPFTIGQRHTTSPLDKGALQDLRLYDKVLSVAEIKSLGFGLQFEHLASLPPEKRTKEQKNSFYDEWLTKYDTNYQAMTKELASLEAEQGAIKLRGTVAHVMNERTNTPMAFVLSRGEYDKHKDEVHPITPAAFPPMAKDWPKNRLGLAKWLVAPENPLMARTTVNRFWQEVFGAGIVRTTGDLGVSGEMPSHQELLDWMAVDFREGNWDVKRFFKQLVTSAAYRQAATVTPEKLQKDPANKLLSRGPRFRMDAEMVRDYALKASGLLVTKIGGPSVKPYQPPGVWESIAMIGSDTRDYKQDTGEKLYRRSMYTFWKRTAPPAMLDIFNAPSRETCTVRRERTDTPLQALATMNDPQFVEAARHLAERALAEKKESARLEFMAEQVLDRPLRSEELKVTSGILDELLTHYKSDPKDADALIAVGESKPAATVDHPTLAAYTMVANDLLNLDEALNK